MRLQILHLPAPQDEHPFALVIDRYDADEPSDSTFLTGVRERLGARAVLVFEGEVEIA